jgi:tRNA dimethylallyltransferase
VAVELADLLRDRGEDPVAISADALQVYRGLETLTGAATAAEQARLEHRLVGVVPVSESFSVGEFMPLAHEAIDDALANGRGPIVVGGTGLYLRAALSELDLRPPPAAGVREALERRLAESGPEALHAELSRRSPRAGAAVEPADRSRLLRALELMEMGEEPPGDGDQLWSGETRHPTVLFGLTMDREVLRERIDHRVDEIVAAGAIEEARRANAAGASPTARKALGFEELLAGDIEAVKRSTRQLAKRQLTWMRKLPGLRTIDVTGRAPRDVAAEIVTGLT